MRPWEIREGESSKAYAAFCAYLELGPKRSIDAAHRASKGDQEDIKGRSWWLRWSTEYDWVARATSYDAHELLQWIDARADVRERARQVLFEGIRDAVVALLDIATGKDTAESQQVAAIKEVLAQCGMVPADPRGDEQDDGKRALTLDELSEIFNEDELDEFEALCNRAADRRERAVEAREVVPDE